MVIEPGTTVNVGTQWFSFTETGFEEITGSADWNNNIAWFYDIAVYEEAIAQGMAFEGYNKKTVKRSYVQASKKTTESQDAMSGETGAKNVSDMKKQTTQQTKGRYFYKKHGKTKEKVSKEAEVINSFCANGILFGLDIMRKNNMNDLANEFQRLLYKTDSTDPKSLRALAASISARVHERLEEHIAFAEDKSLMDVVTLKEFVDEDGNKTKRTILDMLVELLILVYNQMQAFAKEWSKGTVFLPFRVIMEVFKIILDIVRTIAGGIFYIVNGVVCLVDAALLKLETFLFGLIVFLKNSFANWNTIKDEPAAA